MSDEKKETEPTVLRGFYLDEGNETLGLEFYDNGKYKFKKNNKYLCNCKLSNEKKIELIDTILKRS